MRLIDLYDLCRIIELTGIEAFNKQVLNRLEFDFARWQDFNKSPRHATHYPLGVIELMPCSDDEYYAFKYVNGHPANPALGKSSVVAFGVLTDVTTGYPLMMSEMTILTAIRTAATAALGVKYLARSNSTKLALIGTGAQAEFLIYALDGVMHIDQLRYFDKDAAAMCKFSDHLDEGNSYLIPAATIAAAIDGADVIVTATADKRRNELFRADQIENGTHIHAMGGDCPGKTELDPALLDRSKLVVEYLDQTRNEGEMQNMQGEAVYAELWEVVGGHKPGRVNEQEITLFDAVGVAVEDFSILKLVYELAAELCIGKEVDLIPALDNPKDLFGMLRSTRTLPRLYRRSI